VLQAVDEECHGAVITIDTGAMRIAANHLVHASQPNLILQSNGLGTMGYALPAAIGAQFADANQLVVALTGDAGLLMLMGELSVAVAHSFPIIVVVFVDNSLALIDLKQSRMHYHHVGVDITVPNFAGVAEQFGGNGYYVHSLEEFRENLRDAVGRRQGLTVIHVPIDPSSYQALM
jgi:acetolactate synthase-1/2/3 large subunit